MLNNPAYLNFDILPAAEIDPGLNPAGKQIVLALVHVLRDVQRGLSGVKRGPIRAPGRPASSPLGLRVRTFEAGIAFGEVRGAARAHPVPWLGVAPVTSTSSATAES